MTQLRFRFFISTSLCWLSLTRTKSRIMTENYMMRSYEYTILIQRENSQGMEPDQQHLQQTTDRGPIEPSSPLPETVKKKSSEIENFAIPRSSGENVKLQQRGGILRRKRALLTAEMAREVFNLRGRLATSERETGNYSSLFTARSILVSQVVIIPLYPSIPRNATKEFGPHADDVSRTSLLFLQRTMEIA